MANSNIGNKNKKNITDNLKKKNLTQKEINKRKYDNRQKVYRENRQKQVEQKKKSTVPDTILTKEKIKKEETNKNVKNNKIKKGIKNISNLRSDVYNNVKSKTSDSSIPLGKSKKEKKERKRRYIKEAIVFALIITFINLLSYVLFDYVSLLRLSDIKIFNVLATMIASFIIGFIFSYIIDYLVSELWVKIKRKRTGGTDGNKGSKQEEHKEDIVTKKGE